MTSQDRGNRCNAFASMEARICKANEQGTKQTRPAWYCTGAQEDAMSKAQKPLKPDDFPVNAEGKKIKKQDGTPIANTDDPTVAADVAERLNDDEARREEDKWSA